MTATPRLFFALWPDDAVRHALLHWQTHHLPASVRWQHRADLHLTMHFLGSVEHDRVEALVALGDQVSHQAFGLVLDKIGRWPKPGVLWCGPSSRPYELDALHDALAVGLTQHGFAVDSRPFRPHVTLARKVRKAADYGPLSPVSWSVRELALVESRPGGTPVYHPIRSWTLR